MATVTKIILVAIVFASIQIKIGQSLPRSSNNCPRVNLAFGRVRYRQKYRIARFACNVGYILAGQRYARCVDDKWDEEVPRCVKPTCQKVKAPLNGFIQATHAGGVTNFYCAPGYLLKGAPVIYCDGSKWDNVTPTCLEGGRKPSLSCDFETVDICGWTNDVNHDFDWTRQNYRTPSWSVRTGPSYDHTKGAGQNGYYMYIESSSQQENDTARLISPIFDKPDDSATTTTCLEFYYHMWGSTTGTLRVFAKTVSDDWTLDPARASFVKSGNQGDSWFRAYVDLGRISDEYQIVFEGVRGNGYVSDIAIDDVTVTEKCDYEIPTTTTMDFDSSSSTMTTEEPQKVDSCLSRCNEDPQATTNVTSPYEITCDCDSSCNERERCCPDWFDLCFDLETSTETIQSRVETSPTDVITTTTTTNIPITTRPTTKLLPMTTRVTTKQLVTRPTTTRPPLMTLPVTTQPTRIITWAATTRRYVTLATSKSRIIYVKPPTDDVEEVPKPVLPTDDDVSNDVEIIPSDISRNVPNVVMQKTVELPDTVAPSSPLRTILVITMATICAIVIVAAPLVLYRRYRHGDGFCSRDGVRQSSNGDSQSDMRYLTGEEKIDCSWADDGDSNDL